jgi:demethylmenaquinone methyltransferase/2-methoxy-6-polyprenyl-1,4-benzoquinol methylase
MALAQGNFSPPRGDAKRGYVQEMFTAIAPRYDFLNHALSLNIDRSWRRQAVRALEWKAVPEGTYLDLCAGTLDLAAELSHQPGFQGTVIGADFVVPMLRLGASKGNQLNPVGADALGLPFPDASFDGCAVAFGARNLADLGEGLEEMARVIKPGGRLVVLEFTTPSFAPVRALYLGYFRLILPMVGRLISRHKTAYSYLPNSVLEFPEPAAFGELISQSGFDAVSWSTVTFGIAAIHVGTRT